MATDQETRKQKRDIEVRFFSYMENALANPNTMKVDFGELQSMLNVLRYESDSEEPHSILAILQNILDDRKMYVNVITVVIPAIETLIASVGRMDRLQRAAASRRLESLKLKLNLESIRSGTINKQVTADRNSANMRNQL